MSREPHVFIEPNKTYIEKPPSPGGFPPTYYHAGEEAPNLDEQITETIETLSAKTIGDENIFYFIDFYVSKNHPVTDRILQILNAEILLELSQTKVLIKSSMQNLIDSKERIISRKTYESNIFSIKAIGLDDIIDEELDYIEKYIGRKELTIHLIPNIGYEPAERYVNTLITFFEEQDIEIISTWIDEHSGNSIIDCVLNRVELLDIAEQSNFIYKVHEMITYQESQPQSVSSQHDFSIADISDEEFSNLPTICMLDTGVNLIPQLRQYVTSRTFESPLSTLDDNNNHGTSVASLIVFGDSIGSGGIHYPKAKVVSHKIIDGRRKANLINALSSVFNLYTDINTINCSVGSTGSRIALTLMTQRINALTQRTNRLVVFSAGNITLNDLRTLLNSGSSYPHYIHNAPVAHPSDAPSVLSIGAITRKSNSNSIAPIDAPSPITKNGTYLRDLFNCPKPEIVEHGGNVCFSQNVFSCRNVGINALNDQGVITDVLGTSFAAPLVAQHLARIWSHFEQRIRNSETVKSILISTCNPTNTHQLYQGFGVPEETNLLWSEDGSVLIVFEGSLKLMGTAAGREIIPVDEIKIHIPSEVEIIDFYLVHSDDYQLRAFPSLNTYINVQTEKPGKSGRVRPTSGNQRSRTHVKHLHFRYQRNIKGMWYFKLIPVSINIPRRHRPNVTIRYGGVVRLIPKRPVTRLGREVMTGLRRGESTQISLSNFLVEA